MTQKCTASQTPRGKERKRGGIKMLRQSDRRCREMAPLILSFSFNLPFAFSLLRLLCSPVSYISPCHLLSSFPSTLLSPSLLSPSFVCSLIPPIFPHLSSIHILFPPHPPSFPLPSSFVPPSILFFLLSPDTSFCEEIEGAKITGGGAGGGGSATVITGDFFTMIW